MRRSTAVAAGRCRRPLTKRKVSVLVLVRHYLSLCRFHFQFGESVIACEGFLRRTQTQNVFRIIEMTEKKFKCNRTVKSIKPDRNLLLSLSRRRSKLEFSERMNEGRFCSVHSFDTLKHCQKNFFFLEKLLSPTVIQFVIVSLVYSSFIILKSRAIDSARH